MKKKFIVKYNRDFEKIMEKGYLKKSSSYVIYSMENEYNYDRYGISVSKKIGNAVFRNKYKRKIRFIIDNYKKNYINGKDYIIILRKGAIEKTYSELEQEFFQLMNS